MKPFSEHHGRSATKLCFIGDSGSGKTGALAALVNAGHKLAIWDFDNGLDILWEFSDPELLKANVQFETYIDKVKIQGTRTVHVKVDSAELSTKSLNEFINGEPTDRIMVIDSGTHWGESLLRFAMKMNPGATRWESFGPAMEMQEGLLNAFHGVPWLNLIICWHKSPQDIDPDSGLSQFYPSALGKKLPPKVGTYFNNVIAIESKGSGENATRSIRTVSGKQLELKTSAPRSIPAEIPLAVDKNGLAQRGLAEFFRIAQTQKGSTQS